MDSEIGMILLILLALKLERMLKNIISRFTLTLKTICLYISPYSRVLLFSPKETIKEESPSCQGTILLEEDQAELLQDLIT